MSTILKIYRKNSSLNSLTIVFAVLQLLFMLDAYFSPQISETNFATRIYAQWHADTDLQIMAKVVAVPGTGNSNGLYLVTSSSKDFAASEVNRFRFSNLELVAQDYWSSSGLFAVFVNYSFTKVFSFLNPFIFLFILRIVFLIIAIISIRILIKTIVKHRSSRFIFALGFFTFFNPWFFLGATSFFWSDWMRFSPVIYLLYLESQGKSPFVFKRLLVLFFLLVTSTFSGFEVAVLVYGVSAGVLLSSELFPKYHILRFIIPTYIFAALASIYCWFIVLLNHFQTVSTSLQIISYTLVKHGIAPPEATPKGALSAGSGTVTLMETFLNLFFKTSLLLPYDLTIQLKNEIGNRHVVNLFTLLTSSIVVMLLFVWKFSLNSRIVFTTLSLFLWFLIINSYAYHHVHLLGSSLLILWFVVFTKANNRKFPNAVLISP